MAIKRIEYMCSYCGKKRNEICVYGEAAARQMSSQAGKQTTFLDGEQKIGELVVYLV